MKFFERKEELKTLGSFALSPKSEFLYVRGRRRIGKSWLLHQFQKKCRKRSFLFSGMEDSTTHHILKNFILKWSEFSGNSFLLELKESLLTWSRIFEEVGKYAKKNKKPLILIFDEVQWIALEGAGFAGALKEAWINWQQDGLIKVIICGSSNKFFKEKTGGENNVLRGLHTKAHLWVRPLTPSEVKKHCFPQWNLQEAALAYMMIGGIPYYLERIDPQKGFVHALNDAFFTSENNLLDEVDELLNLDFNSAGKKTAKRILSVLGQDGLDQKNICIKTGLPSNTVYKVVNKLLDYELVFEKPPGLPLVGHQHRGVRYFMKDFYLNCYFQMFSPYAERIRFNAKRGLIFPEGLHLSKNGYFIPGFSGKAFELFCRDIFEGRSLVQGRWAQKILLKNEDYEVFDYWDKKTQIDLIIQHKTDRITRLFECKWGSYKNQWLEEVLNKTYSPPKHHTLKRYLITMEPPTSEFQKKARQQGVELLDLTDFY